ncbi:hypothetical protein CONCODRAFT_3925 [Conidiobolus coronatus NRRL 28638]|uniref:Uncharacterized protein n=1 Tax=Conidiobolus coronatus (strain ATCC 28846 / CBS 209.66 / NRRL 28638) TaxID=796925 RepID=A0A137PE22_CONC2|nr:hypothetical protein CONCODRAFT_3925 [Conidiobolus coronatus NRRL 28638]|eukprot:KXN73246.1 hypothetical protein CONCODRAFT_3925 [Conidiobolus coronatus NRRL 28638]
MRKDEFLKISQLPLLCRSSTLKLKIGTEKREARPDFDIIPPEQSWDIRWLANNPIFDDYTLKVDAVVEEHKNLSITYVARRVFSLNKTEWKQLIFGVIGACGQGSIFPCFAIIFPGMLEAFNNP